MSVAVQAVASRSVHLGHLPPYSGPSAVPSFLHFGNGENSPSSYSTNTAYLWAHNWR
jgi:hypothetical protein